jgi:hypothetical protein
LLAIDLVGDFIFYVLATAGSTVLSSEKYTLSTYTPCTGDISSSTFESTQNVDVGSENAFFEFQEFECSTQGEIEGSGLSYQVINHSDIEYSGAYIYEHVEKGCLYDGQNIQTLNDKSLQECIDVCDGDTLCKAFQYFTDHGEDDSTSELGDCIP